MADRSREDYTETYEACPIGGTFEAYGDGKTYEKIAVGDSTQAINREEKRLEFFFATAPVKILSNPEPTDEELERLTDPNEEEDDDQ